MEEFLRENPDYGLSTTPASNNNTGPNTVSLESSNYNEIGPFLLGADTSNQYDYSGNHSGNNLSVNQLTRQSNNSNNNSSNYFKLNLGSISFAILSMYTRNNPIFILK